jgi:serine/threonine-protein phosphatase 2A regulatory subunit A
MNKFIEPLFYSYLKDRASSVRELGLSRLKQIVTTFKADWTVNSLLPKLQEALGKDNGYLTKITAVNSLQVKKNQRKKK